MRKAHTVFTAWAAIALSVLLAVPGANHAVAQTGQSTGLQLSGDQPVQIEGDRFEVFEEQSRAVFTGNVRVSQGPTVLRTGKLTIHYASGSDGGSITSGTSKIKLLEATGGVNVQSARQVATGDTGVFDMATEVLVLSGNSVTLSEDGNVATGCKLTIAMKTGRAKLEGCGGASRPTILLQPQSDDGN
jgi:lipopolysaccharide export system protein LptA